ncbi:MAG: porin [Roseiarcus sp.]
MTLIKSLLLGSAATLVVVAAAQAADLPTKKGAPVAQYVKICNIGGVAGFVIPGSDTCLKISGTLYAMGEVGNLNQQYDWAGTTKANSVHGFDESALKQGADTNTRDDLGYYTRFNFALDAANNTAYGVLTAHIDINFNIGSGFNSPGSVGYAQNWVNINHAYLQWAGFTAGVHDSYFSFFGGGEGWENTMSPDRKGYNQPNLFAYTATFGGGFSATVSLEDPTVQNPTMGAGSPINWNGTDFAITGNSQYLGLRAPDIIGAIDLVQGWGGAHLAVVAHNVNMQDNSLGAYTLNTWGWAIDGGVKFNLPSIGAGDNIQLQGAWSENAVWYSGMPDAMNGDLGQVNGNGIPMPFADAFSNGLGQWATPTAWSIAATGEFHFGPTFFIAPEIAYGQLTWSNSGYGAISDNVQSWTGGAVFHWDPVAHLDFALELLYQGTNQSMPTKFTQSTGYAPWQGNTNGGVARLMVTRDF